MKTYRMFDDDGEFVACDLCLPTFKGIAALVGDSEEPCDCCGMPPETFDMTDTESISEAEVRTEKGQLQFIVVLEDLRVFCAAPSTSQGRRWCGQVAHSRLGDAWKSLSSDLDYQWGGKHPKSPVEPFKDYQKWISGQWCTYDGDTWVPRV